MIASNITYCKIKLLRGSFLKNFFLLYDTGKSILIALNSCGFCCDLVDGTCCLKKYNVCFLKSSDVNIDISGTKFLNEFVIGYPLYYFHLLFITALLKKNNSLYIYKGFHSCYIFLLDRILAN